MKPIQDWLRELPDGYRELALVNHSKPSSYNFEVKSLSEAVIEFIDWSKTNEGGKFWMDVSDYIDGHSKYLPSIPVPKVDERDAKIAQLTASNNSLAAALDQRYMDNCVAGHAIEDALETARFDMRPDTFFSLKEKAAKIIEGLSK
jgi:hypothetical protein